MSGSINALGQSPVTPEISGQNGAAATSRAGAAADSAESASSGEAVTLSADAETMTQLLGAARNADGINQSAVQQLRAAIQSGTYEVSPENLASAMGAALKEASS